MRNNSGISYLLAGALVVALSAPVLAASEEDAAAPAGSFVSTMTYPGAVPAKAVQADASANAVRLARASAK